MSANRKDVLKTFEAKRDYMEDRIRNGIETGRKSFCTLWFGSGKGETVSHVHVKAMQKSHSFRYGANLFMLDEFNSAEQNAAYRQLFADAFNMATLPFYWNDLEPEQGKVRFTKDSPKIYRRPAPDLCLEYCAEHHIEPKAHCLNYVSFQPSWVGDELQQQKMFLAKRFQELGEHYSQKIKSWEVTNETYWGDKTCPANFLDPELVEWSFKTAEKYFPGNKLIINEASQVWGDSYCRHNRSPYYMQIERAMLKGARVDGIAMQYHMFYPREKELQETGRFYDPEQLFGVMDVYSHLNKPLQVSEVTIPAYSYMPEDEELQAEILRTLYRIWFSHPAMEAIIYWNLIDGFAAFAPQGDMTKGENYYHGGLLRYDFTPKPAYYAVKELFEKTWHTECEKDSGDSNVIMFKGFHGTYDLEITANGRTFHKEILLRKEDGWTSTHSIQID